MKKKLHLLFVIGLFLTATNTIKAQNLPISTGDTWSYNDSGTDLGTAWTSTTYDDSAWVTGASKLGYGDGNAATTLSYGTDSSNKYPTYYFRKTLNVTDASQVGDLIFNVLFDDGVAVYLNGTEVYRANLAANATYSDFATGTVAGSDENDYDNFLVSGLLVDGVNIIAVEVHQTSGSSSDMGFDLTVEDSNTIVIPATFPLTQGASWSYLDNGSDQTNTTWNQAGFDFSSWSNGAAPLGYNNPVVTNLSFGPDANNKFITSYFIKELDVDVNTITDDVVFGLLRDDGAIVYVNGQEVIRDNMPAGVIDYLTHSSTIVSGADEGVYYIHRVPKSFFQNGINTIAVELHNRDGQSSDLSFDMFIENDSVTVTPYNCQPGDIGCFTSIVPTGQTSNMIYPTAHRFQMLFKQGEQYTDGSGTVPGNNDFTGYVPATAGSSTNGFVSVNHETTPGGVSIVDVTFDAASNLWVKNATSRVDLYNNALVTTTRNCSGGTTPWGTIITAEESTNGGDVNADGYQDVGWLVEIDPVTRMVKDYGNGQEKLWAMGRMNHENVVVSNDRITAYYGEDGGTDAVYKFVANTPGDLSSGTVYALVLDAPLVGNDPTSTTASWVLVPNTTPAERNDIRNAAAALGATNFNGVEDCEINPVTGEIFFTSKGKGRTYKFTDNGTTVSGFETYVGGRSYDITTANGVFTESWGGGNDNLTFDDKGNLWVLQDGGNNYIWVVRPGHTQANPQVELFASMPVGSEPTGLTFTPDFKYGFFSVQHPSGSNSPQIDATFNNVVFDKSSTIVFAVSENLGLQSPVADFTSDTTMVGTNGVITYTDLSTNTPDSWNWVFEGGQPATSTDQSPVVTYSTPGIYDVSLTTSNVAGSSDQELKADYANVGTASIDEALLGAIQLYPNPNKGQLNIDITGHEGENLSVEVYDLQGRKIAHFSNFENNSLVQHLSLDLTSVTTVNQLFIVKVNVGDLSGSYKVVRN